VWLEEAGLGGKDGLGAVRAGDGEVEGAVGGVEGEGEAEEGTAAALQGDEGGDGGESGGGVADGYAVGQLARFVSECKIPKLLRRSQAWTTVKSHR
jgi:hypothetical protein